MNKGFTRLEIILVGIIFLTAIGFFAKNQISNPETENNKTPTKDVGLCTREKPYDNSQELLRALSLAYERSNPAPNSPATPKGSYKNCLHLIYKDSKEMSDAEGLFSFDPNSAPNDLRIYVSTAYKNYDDILTASLLTHELRHATFLIKTLQGTPEPNCVDNEAAAFYSQLVFLTNLNPEEWKSLTYRVSQNPHLNSAYETTDYLLRLNMVASKACPNDLDQSCWNSYVLENLTRWVKSNPYYQKQCNL